MVSTLGPAVSPPLARTAACVIDRVGTAWVREVGSNIRATTAPEGMSSESESTRICFPFLNHGACSRGSLCRFRHLDQDHPDAIADRVRTGHVDKLVGKLPAEQVRRDHLPQHAGLFPTLLV